MSENGYDSEGNPLTPRWDGRERRRFPRNGKVTPLTLDQKLDRALKFATLFKFIVLPLLGGIVTVAWMNHRTLEALDTKARESLREALAIYEAIESPYIDWVRRKLAELDEAEP